MAAATGYNVVESATVGTEHHGGLLLRHLRFALQGFFAVLVQKIE